MEKITYFSKVFFLEKEPFSRENVLTLDLVQRELSFKGLNILNRNRWVARLLRHFIMMENWWI